MKFTLKDYQDEAVADVLDRLKKARKRLGHWRDDQAALIFAARLESGQIEFRIRGDGGDWIMPTQLFAIAPENADLLTRSSGTALERSLFLPIFKHELNGDEQGLARKLDENAMIRWWHRNGTVRGDYALHGWPHLQTTAGRGNSKAWQPT